MRSSANMPKPKLMFGLCFFSKAVFVWNHKIMVITICMITEYRTAIHSDARFSHKNKQPCRHALVHGMLYP